MKIEVAIFDWNGTLINDFPVHYATVTEILKNFGIRPLGVSDLKSYYCFPYMKFYRRIGITKKMATRDKLDKLYVGFYEEYTKHNLVKLFSRVKKTLIWFREKGIKSAIVSAYPQDALERILRTKKLDSLLNYIIGDAYYKDIVLQQFVEKRNINPKSAFYLDDRAEGVLAAKKAGLIAGGFLRGWHTKEKILEASPDFTIKNLWELTKIITEGETK